MKSSKLVAGLVLACAALTSGCVAYGSAEADAPVVYADDPELVAVDNDTWVVRDYDRAVYYVGDSYWVYRDDSWYRSNYYDRGWTGVSVNVVPISIARRRHDVYVHYRGDAQARRRAAPRAHRDHRNDGNRRRPDGVHSDQGGRGRPQGRPTRDDRKRDNKHDHDR